VRFTPFFVNAVIKVPFWLFMKLKFSVFRVRREQRMSVFKTVRNLVQKYIYVKDEEELDSLTLMIILQSLEEDNATE